MCQLVVEACNIVSVCVLNGYIYIAGSDLALAMMEETMRLLADLNVTTVVNGSGYSSDTGRWVLSGVPGVELMNDDEKYFWLHHSAGTYCAWVYVYRIIKETKQKINKQSQ